jgi:hypothetical protein
VALHATRAGDEATRVEARQDASVDEPAHSLADHRLVGLGAGPPLNLGRGRSSRAREAITSHLLRLIAMRPNAPRVTE